MHRPIRYFGLSATFILATSCGSHYTLSSVERSRILIDKRYDAQPDAAAAAFIAPYKHRVDSIMSPVVGSAVRTITAHRPWSPLSNLLTDILVWGGKLFNEHPDFAVYNMGGIRAALVQGPVTYGDVVDMAPFENKICFVTLSGTKVLQLFSEIASTGGEGVSSSVRLVITHDGKLKSAQVNGQNIDRAKTYRIATLDYVAQGNDKMEAFKSATDVVSPTSNENNIRFIIIDYFREAAAQGRSIDGPNDERIKVE